MFEANTIEGEYASSLDDDEILVQAAQRNPADFKPIYQKWLKPVYRYFYFRVGNESALGHLKNRSFTATARIMICLKPRKALNRE